MAKIQINNTVRDMTPEEEAQLNASHAAIQAELNHYITKRIKEYPAIGDQLDMQYHDLVDGTTTWKDAVQAVKDAHPKP